MSAPLRWFAVRVYVHGEPSHVLEAAVPHLQEELDARPYLRRPRVRWDAAAAAIAVELEDEARTEAQAREGVYDEVFEATCAVIGDFDSLRVEVIAATPAHPSIASLHKRLVALPFPPLGKQVGDFPLYDSLLTGVAARAARGDSVRPEDVPAPDAATTDAVASLQRKKTPTPEERAFLEYFGALEALRSALLATGAADGAHL